MKSPLELFDSLKTSLFKAYSHDAGKMLLHTGTLGWIFSAAGQIFGIATNDKVSKEQKKFLIPQEMADAAINILSFYTLTAFIQNSAKGLASSGRIITPAIRKFCEEQGIKLIRGEDGAITNIGNAISERITKLRNTIDANSEEVLEANPAKIEGLEREIKALNEFKDDVYAPFESGIRVIGNVVGAVLSSNIVTPLLRNPLAAAKQKQALAQQEMQDKNVMPAPRVILGQNQVSMDNYRKQVNLQPNRISSNGAMRI